MAKKPSTERPAYQQRVLDEYRELQARRDKLAAFINGATLDSPFAKLDGAEQQRMRRQLSAMNEYANVLRERINAFTPGAPVD